MNKLFYLLVFFFCISVQTFAQKKLRKISTIYDHIWHPEVEGEYVVDNVFLYKNGKFDTINFNVPNLSKSNPYGADEIKARLFSKTVNGRFLRKKSINKFVVTKDSKNRIITLKDSFPKKIVNRVSSDLFARLMTSEKAMDSLEAVNHKKRKENPQFTTDLYSFDYLNDSQFKYTFSSTDNIGKRDDPYRSFISSFDSINQFSFDVKTENKRIKEIKIDPTYLKDKFYRAPKDSISLKLIFDYKNDNVTKVTFEFIPKITIGMKEEYKFFRFPTDSIYSNFKNNVLSHFNSKKRFTEMEYYEVLEKNKFPVKFQYDMPYETAKEFAYYLSTKEETLKYPKITYTFTYEYDEYLNPEKNLLKDIYNSKDFDLMHFTNNAMMLFHTLYDFNSRLDRFVYQLKSNYNVPSSFHMLHNYVKNLSTNNVKNIYGEFSIASPTLFNHRRLGKPYSLEGKKLFYTFEHTYTNNTLYKTKGYRYCDNLNGFMEKSFSHLYSFKKNFNPKAHIFTYRYHY